MIRRAASSAFGILIAILGGNPAAWAAMSSAKPQVFAPAVITGAAGVDCLAFTPDGNTVFFDREAEHGITIMVSSRVKGVWSAPQVAAFSGTWADHDPDVSPDGSFIVFTSNRPSEAGGRALRGGHLWRVDRQGDGWGDPVAFPEVVNATDRIFAPSIAANGDVYFQRSDPPLKEFHLYRTQYRHGTYLEPTRVPLGEPKAHELDPAVAPDQSFIVFDANYTGDKNKDDRLYIAFRNGDGWSQPVDMGDALNSYVPWGSHLSPDHRTLFFTSDHPLDGSGSAKVNHIWSISLEPWLKKK